MYADPRVDAALFELEERHRRADMHRLSNQLTANHARRAGRVRSACGSALVRFGGFVSGDDGVPDPSPREVSA